VGRIQAGTSCEKLRKPANENAVFETCTYNRQSPPAARAAVESLLPAFVEEPGGIYRDMFCLFRDFSGQLAFMCFVNVTGSRC
jgi:hypothetical protein